jgi:hypothetical protein
MNTSRLISSRTYKKHVEVPDAVDIEENDETDACLVAIEWLKSNEGPWVEVIRNWQNSRPMRRQLLERSASVHQYLSLFPCMNNNEALELVRSFLRGKSDEFYLSSNSY